MTITAPTASPLPPAQAWHRASHKHIPIRLASYSVGGAETVRIDPPPRPAVFGVDWTIPDPQPWQEVEVDGAVMHFDPLRRWQPGPAPEWHHRQCRERTDDEQRALVGYGLDDEATLTRRMTTPPQREAVS